MLKKLLATTALSALLVAPVYAQETQPTDDPIEAPADTPDVTEDLADPADDPLADPADDPLADPADDPLADPADDPMADPDDDMEPDTAPTEIMITPEELMGADILGFDGDVIGTVDDVVLDGAGGIETILVNVGGFFGFGATTVGIAFTDVSVDRDEDGEIVLRTQLTADDLEGMPAYQAAG